MLDNLDWNFPLSINPLAIVFPQSLFIEQKFKKDMQMHKTKIMIYHKVLPPRMHAAVFISHGKKGGEFYVRNTKT